MADFELKSIYEICYALCLFRMVLALSSLHLLYSERVCMAIAMEQSQEIFPKMNCTLNLQSPYCEAHIMSRAYSKPSRQSF
jgi:hypothetical protein